MSGRVNGMSYSGLTKIRTRRREPQTVQIVRQGEPTLYWFKFNSLYALDQGELEGILERLAAEKVKESAYSISRFKGLGEMNPDQLKDTTMNPDTRRLLRVGIPEHDSETTLAAFTRLMGKGEAAARRSWMEAEGDRVEADI